MENALRLEKKVFELIERPGNKDGESLFFDNPIIIKSFGMAKEAIKRNMHVYVSGETGVGKSTFVRALAKSFSKHRDFYEVNIASLPATLLESELFGYARGAFTGAVASRDGFFEKTGSGILFLDEIGDLPLELQSTILAAIGDRIITKIGTTCTRRFEGVCIFATNRDLENMVRKGEFRKDLYHRINVIRVEIPPLRKRKAEAAIITDKLLDSLNASLPESRKKVLSDEVVAAMDSYHWPGNIRELENFLNLAFVRSEKKIIRLADVHFFDRQNRSNDPGDEIADVCPSNILVDVERHHILKILKKNRWVQKDAAEELGLSPRAMNYKVVQHGITHENWRRNK